MKDIIWTIIVIWLIYKIADMFRSASKKNPVPPGSTEASNRTSTLQDPPSEKDIRTAVNKHVNTEGEYVDFEELK